MTGTEPTPFTLTLDFYPNPDHAGIYMAEKLGYFDDAGLDVSIQTPSDPAAPTKLVAAGQSDLAISYEPEVLLANEKGLDVIAIGALVDSPLTSMIWLAKSGIGGIAGLRGKTIATAGIPYQDAYLQTILARGRPDPGGRENGQRRLRPPAGDPRRRGRRDARRLPQRRGRRPAAARESAGRHPRGPARRPHLRRARAGREPRAARGGPRALSPLPRRPLPRNGSRRQEPRRDRRRPARGERRTRPETDPGRGRRHPSRCSAPTGGWTPPSGPSSSPG